MRRRLLPPSSATSRGFGVVAGSLVAGCVVVASASDLGGIIYRCSCRNRFDVFRVQSRT